MAQRAIIGINGDLIGFDEQLDRIQTPGIGGGSVTWVPEADTRCETLNVTANGTYVAADAGKYGYDYVTVNVPGSSVTGRDPDTGEEVEVHKDPETGEIVETVIPVEIRVTTPPTKTVYTHGETIDYSGIVVHAYSATGQDMGAVPFNQLVFPETTADAQKTDGWTDGHGLNAMHIAYVPTWRRDISESGQETEVQVFCCTKALGTDRYGRPCSFGGDGPATLFVTRYNGINYAARITGNKRVDQYSYFNGDATPYRYMSYGWGSTGGTSAMAGDRVFSAVSFEGNITRLPVSTVDPTTVDPTNLHATQSLPVQWPRTPNGAVLETSFSINVTGGST